MAEIEFRNLGHSYQQVSTDSKQRTHRQYALKPLNHTWKQGGAYALLGPSGCGKTTLLNIISGLLEPSDGEIVFDGNVVNHLSPQARNVAQVFQFPVVYDSMTVAENLAFPLKNMGVSKSKIAERVADIAGLMDIEPLLKRKANSLSADQKQKISMARGLVREDVSAILFDEPLTVIDPHVKWTLRRKLKQLHRALNITMIYVTHDQLEAATFADEIAVMHDGNIVQFGTPDKLFRRPEHTFVGHFIGSPGMNFFDVEMTSSDCQVGDVSLPIPEHLRAEIQSVGQQARIQLGIRPEFIYDEPTQDCLDVQVSLDSAEHHGTHQLVYAQWQGMPVIARLAEHASASPGPAIWFFDSRELLLFVDERLIGAWQEGAKDA